MGQFSMEKPVAPGSTLSGNQQIGVLGLGTLAFADASPCVGMILAGRSTVYIAFLAFCTTTWSRLSDNKLIRVRVRALRPRGSVENGDVNFSREGYPSRPAEMRKHCRGQSIIASSALRMRFSRTCPICTPSISTTSRSALKSRSTCALGLEGSEARSRASGKFVWIALGGELRQGPSS